MIRRVNPLAFFFFFDTGIRTYSGVKDIDYTFNSHFKPQITYVTSTTVCLCATLGGGTDEAVITI